MQGVTGKKPDKISYVNWQIIRKYSNKYLVGAVGIDQLEFLIDTLPWKFIWNTVTHATLHLCQQYPQEIWQPLSLLTNKKK